MDNKYLIIGHSVEDIRNDNELLIIKKINEAFQNDPQLCRCRLCVEDIYALSLNYLPARYKQSLTLATLHGEKGWQIEDARIEEAVRSAIEQVKKRPHH
ncbi:MAG: late competence development ComFB family protein [Nitrospinae bacterium]|nr:late competence development ComFB family protein [Nitrospinota bacterium]